MARTNYKFEKRQKEIAKKKKKEEKLQLKHGQNSIADKEDPKAGKDENDGSGV